MYADALFNDGDAPHGRELIKQQQALVPQAGASPAAACPCSVQEAAEKKIQKLTELVNICRLHHHIDTHALLRTSRRSKLLEAVAFAVIGSLKMPKG